MSAQAMLQARGLVVQAGRERLLDVPELHFADGRLTAVLGPNGAGKSTLLGVLAGLHRPAQGEVLVGGRRIEGRDAAALARERAYLPQEHPVAFSFTARQVVELGRYAHRHTAGADEAAIVDAALRETGVVRIAGRVYNTLSGGEKARVQLSRALAQVWPSADEPGARWLMLDEPTAALDVHHAHRVLQAVRRWLAARPGAGAVAVLHDLNLALRHADDVCVLEGGRCVAAGPAGTVLTEALVARVWRVSCETVRMRDGHRQLLMAPAD